MAFSRRSATLDHGRLHRGLKSKATVMASLREAFGRMGCAVS